MGVAGGSHVLLADFGVARALREQRGRPPHRDRPRAGHAGLHEPRAVAGRRLARRPDRSLQPGLRALRAAGGRAALHRPHRAGDRRQAPDRPGSLRAPAAGHGAARRGPGAPAAAGQGSRPIGIASADALLAALGAPRSQRHEPQSAAGTSRPRRALGRAALVARSPLVSPPSAGSRAIPQPAADPAAVAVLPFRVTAPDRSLDYLGEGIVDLLAVKLAGAADIHAVRHAPDAQLSPLSTRHGGLGRGRDGRGAPGAAPA